MIRFQKIMPRYLRLYTVLLIASPTFAVPCSATPVAKAVLQPANKTAAKGIVTFSKNAHGLTINYDLRGLKPGKHGFHIHEFGDCSNPDATSAGGHFAPERNPHGAPTATRHHVGDLGNIEVPKSGIAKGSETFEWLTVEGEQSILGRAVVVHSDADDLTSQPSGSAGQRVACGIIGWVG